MCLTSLNLTVLSAFTCQQHGQRQPRRPPGAEQTEDEDPGGSRAGRGDAGHRHESRAAGEQTAHAQRTGPDQEPASAEIQEPVYV